MSKTKFVIGLDSVTDSTGRDSIISTSSIARFLRPSRALSFILGCSVILVTGTSHQHHRWMRPKARRTASSCRTTCSWTYCVGYQSVSSPSPGASAARGVLLLVTTTSSVPASTASSRPVSSPASTPATMSVATSPPSSPQ